jgi:NhaP-type Na+/H+ or K+/H+ antiporter
VDTVALASIALLLTLYALISRRLSTTVVSAAMFFLLGGLAIGTTGLGAIHETATSSTIEVLAELTLALVLFGDASRIRPSALRREATLPVRLLGVGLPLTIVAGTVVGLVVLPELLLAEALVLAIILAPTDAALGQAVVTDQRLPDRVRQALNVESGLNDGICVPLLIIALAWADAESGALSASESLVVTAEAIGYGLLGGLAVGAVTAVALKLSARRGWVDASWAQLVPLGAALLAYASADAAGGSGFIAAYVAGTTFGSLYAERDVVTRFLEESGGLFNALTFIVLGAAFVAPNLDRVNLSIAIYAVLSLTVVRMIPVAVSLLGTGARAPTVSFIGWFGPRGLASLVFAVYVLDAEGLTHGDLVVTVALATVLTSVVAHGVSAVPLVNRYADWYTARRKEPLMETVVVEQHRTRHRTFG